MVPGIVRTPSDPDPSPRSQIRGPRDCSNPLRSRSIFGVPDMWPPRLFEPPPIQIHLRGLRYVVPEIVRTPSDPDPSSRSQIRGPRDCSNPLRSRSIFGVPDMWSLGLFEPLPIQIHPKIGSGSPIELGSDPKMSKFFGRFNNSPHFPNDEKQ